MNRFRKENKSVIFISHDLDEIMEVCDTLTVLRDGKIIRTFNKEEFEAGAIRSSMIGRELQGIIIEVILKQAHSRKLR